MVEVSPHPPSLADVARAAGVSASTASKALNNRTDVNRVTRERIARLAKEMGYSPNPVAQALGRGATGTVGVITSDLEGRFAIPMLIGVEDALGTDRVLTFLCDARGDEVREQRLVRTLLERRVDGIIMVGRQTDPRPSLGRVDVPVVYAYAESDDPGDCSVTVDNVQVGRLAGEHLIALGRTRIACISGLVGHGAATDRLAGFTEALSAHGMTAVAEPQFGNWSEGWGRAAMERLLDEHLDVDGVFCASDLVARGALDTLFVRGRSVPGDVAVVGVDNWTTMIDGARVPLTSIDMQLERVGRIAAARLTAAMAGAAPHGTERLAGTLIARASTVPMH